jgi:tetratricopeptide (TPR) repeat protein
MDWIGWVGLSPEKFERKLRRRLTKAPSYNDFIGLHNALANQALYDPVPIAAICAKIGVLLNKRGRLREAMLFLELRARCHFTDIDADNGFSAIHELLDIGTSQANEIALDLARSIYSDLDQYGSSIDQRPRILAGITSVLHRCGRQEEQVEIYLEAAMLYSRHSATQAAYRNVHDAELIAHELQSFTLLAAVYKTAGAVACEEHDFEWAAKAFRLSLKAYRKAKLEPPADLYSNLGVARMNLEELERAVGNFQAALRKTSEPGVTRSTIKVNLAASLRRLGDLDGAAAELASAEEEVDGESWPDQGLELAIGKAKLAQACQDTPALAASLKVIVRRIDDGLRDILRLHHRRGFRERYIERVEALLRSLPNRGATSDALLPIVAARGNAMGDWLSILRWETGAHENPLIPKALKEDLSSILHSVRAFGAPHLYGFREKYDDPWSSPKEFGGPWDRLSEIARKLFELGLPRPLDGSAAYKQVELCLERLADNHCIMMVTFAGESALIWYFIGENYGRREIPYEPLWSWQAAQLSYASRNSSRREFAAAMSSFVDAVAPVLDPVFDEIAAAECRSVRFIQDFSSELPLTLFALRNATLTEKMKSGSFEVRSVPALQAPLPSGKDTLNSVAAIVDLEEDLLLPRFEGAALAKSAAIGRQVVIEVDQEDHLPELLSDAKILIVSTHGYSLQFFNDAYFAHLGSPDRPHPIHVDTLQRIVPDLDLELVVLNTCYSGSVSAKNYQKDFRTSDAVSIPNLFLLNRRAVAIAGIWSVSDTASFVFSSLIGSGLLDKLEPSAALASAIANLQILSKKAALEIVESNLDQDTALKVADRLTAAPEDGMFSDPYFTGGLMIHGLL